MAERPEPLPKTLEQIAVELGCSRQRVAQIEERALDKLRHNAPEFLAQLEASNPRLFAVLRPRHPRASLDESLASAATQDL